MLRIVPPRSLSKPNERMPIATVIISIIHIIINISIIVVVIVTVIAPLEKSRQVKPA